METCKYCGTEVTKDEAIFTDYFQVYGEGATVYTLCGPCYLKEVDRYLAEEKPTCACGAPEVKFYDDVETVDMAITEGLLNLICSEAKKQLDAAEPTLDDLQEKDEHSSNLMLYIKNVEDDEMIWG